MERTRGAARVARDRKSVTVVSQLDRLESRATLMLSYRRTLFAAVLSAVFLGLVYAGLHTKATLTHIVLPMDASPHMPVDPRDMVRYSVGPATIAMPGATTGEEACQRLRHLPPPALGLVHFERWHWCREGDDSDGVLVHGGTNNAETLLDRLSGDILKSAGMSGGPLSRSRLSLLLAVNATAVLQVDAARRALNDQQQGGPLILPPVVAYTRLIIDSASIVLWPRGHASLERVRPGMISWPRKESRIGVYDPCLGNIASISSSSGSPSNQRLSPRKAAHEMATSLLPNRYAFLGPPGSDGTSDCPLNEAFDLVVEQLLKHGVLLVVPWPLLWETWLWAELNLVPGVHFIAARVEGGLAAAEQAVEEGCGAGQAVRCFNMSVLATKRMIQVQSDDSGRARDKRAILLQLAQD